MIRPVLTLVPVILVTIVVACSRDTPTTDPSGLPEIHWRWQVAYSAGDHEAEVSVPRRIELINELTDGKFTIDRYYAGEIMPPEEMLIGVGKGLCEIAEGSPSYWTGVDAALELCQGLPSTQRDPPGDAWAFQNGSAWSEIVREIFAEHNCHYVGWHTYGAYPVFASRVPVRSLNDWKGVKIRISGVSAAELFNMMGASTVYIPGKELYEALMMGTIDVATWTAEFIEEMHFGEVANYLIMPTLIENYGGVTFVNKDAWSSLPGEYKEAIETAERIVHWEAHEYWRDQMEKNLTTLAQKHGYEVIWLPEDDVKEMTRLTIEEVWNKWADKSPRCAKGIQLVKQWYGIE